MRAYLVFTETGPILLLTSCATITEDRLLEALEERGIVKFIAYEVPVDSVHRLYGVPFEVVESDVRRGKPMGVLDFNGPHILNTFSMHDLGRPIPHEH